jgi:uncharacterized membrane protein SpoIIM required for sporulation/ABC-type transport system involved in multi-copper enzyme maturation permease subunit
MRIDYRKVMLILRRELTDQIRDWRILTPMLILALGFPFFMNDVAYRVVTFIANYGGPQVLVDRLVPASIFIIGFFPLTVALVVALEAFVGEKERGTIEPLLSSPMDSRELYLGKLLAGVATPLGASYISILVYMLLITKQAVAMPPFLVFLQLLALTTGHGFLMISASIVVSIQATSIKAANLMASFIVVPVAVLMQSEASMMFWEGDRAYMLWYIVLIIFVATILIVRLGMAHFQREYLLGREIDEFNWLQTFSMFWKNFKGDAGSLSDWYRVSLGATLRKIQRSTNVTILLAIASMALGYWWVVTNVPGYIKNVPPEAISGFSEKLKESPNFEAFNHQISVTYLFRNNARTMIIILLLGILSFGVLGSLILVINTGLIGGVIGLLQVFGLGAADIAGIMVAGVLPHGVFELPALILASASVLHLGVTLVTPQLGKSLGQIFIELLADWTKIFVGLVLPFLVFAAIIETYITPELLKFVLK